MLRNIYLNMLFSALMPALSCITLVWFVTRSAPEDEEDAGENPTKANNV